MEKLRLDRIMVDSLYNEDELMNERSDGCAEWFTVEAGNGYVCIPVECSEKHPCPACAKLYREFTQRFDVWRESGEWSGELFEEMLRAREAIEERKT